jgi:hypothetical protein
VNPTTRDNLITAAVLLALAILLMVVANLAVNVVLTQ